MASEVTVLEFQVQAFLTFCGYDFRNFGYNTVHSSILFSFPLVLLSNLNLRGFLLPQFFICPHIIRVNREMPAEQSPPTYYMICVTVDEFR